MGLSCLNEYWDACEMICQETIVWSVKLQSGQLMDYIAHGLDDLQTSQLAKIFYRIFGAATCSESDFKICCQ